MLSSKFLSKRMILLGHRGSPQLHPENTLPSFQAAMDAGADGIELDVRLSRDREVMVFHDAGLFRMTGIHGALSRKKADELKKLHILGRPIRIPTLEEVFKKFQKKIKYYVEIKAENLTAITGHDLARRTLELVEKYDLVQNVVFVSFDAWIVKWIKEHGPQFQTGFNFSHARALTGPRRHRFSYLDALCFNQHCLSTKLVSEARGFNLSILAWVVNDAATLKKVQAFDVDAVVSDVPHRIVGQVVSHRRRQGYL